MVVMMERPPLARWRSARSTCMLVLASRPEVGSSCWQL